MLTIKGASVLIPIDWNNDQISGRQALAALVLLVCNLFITVQAADQGPASVAQSSVARLSNVLGQTVVNPKGEVVGRVRDVVMDWDSARAAYLVMSHPEQDSADGATLYAVPPTVFEQVPGAGNRLMLNVRPAGLKLLTRLEGPQSRWPARVENPFAGRRPAPPRGATIDRE